jgi:hypothetical protein
MQRIHWSVVRALRNDPRVLERFWTHVRVNEGADACWEWTGGVTLGGYPSFRIAGRSIAASHVTWFVSAGEFPEGGRVKRLCGNVACVRPTHLAWALSSLLERAVESFDDGYVTLPGHAFVPGTRDPRDPRVLRAAVSPTDAPSRDAEQAHDDTADDTAAAA